METNVGVLDACNSNLLEYTLVRRYETPCARSRRRRRVLLIIGARSGGERCVSKHGHYRHRLRQVWCRSAANLELKFRCILVDELWSLVFLIRDGSLGFSYSRHGHGKFLINLSVMPNAVPP